MMKNDYRRSLIMLRVHDQGYSGHVRLERRTLMGTMYVVINAPSGENALCASLVRRGPRGRYEAVKMGPLRRDGRGQATLVYAFDPRNIDGRALEDYWLIAIVSRDRPGRCRVVLSGNINGSREVDWSGVQTAACEACREERPQVCEFCPPSAERPARPGEGPLGPQTPALPPEDLPAGQGEGPAELPMPALPEPPNVPEGEGPVDLPTPVLPDSQPAAPGEGPGGIQTPTFPADSFPLDEGAVPADDLPEQGEGEEETAAAFGRAAAAEALGLDASVPWPGVSEQVRPFFAAQPAEELMLGDGFTYVSAPMPQDSGYDHVEVGLKVENGIPVAMAYALPSRYSPEPPPGLENYVWKGGSADGWWTIQTDVYTGERLL